MIVMKFGGTSVQDADAMQRLARIVAARAGRRPVVLVSAMARVTDTLLTLARDAAAGTRDGVAATLDALRQRHATALRTFDADPAALGPLEARLNSLAEAVAAIEPGPLSPAARDAVVAHGELLSSVVVTAALRSAGLPAEWVDIRPHLRTDDDFGQAAVDFAVTDAQLEAALAPRVAGGALPVTQGFIGRTADGRTTTIGRGGSDYSAAIVGAALRVEEVQIWTDVSGVMTTDPRIVPHARPIAEISFAEAAELAYFGAKVLHPATLRPAVKAGIPVRVCNSQRPEDAGTLVRGEAARRGLVTAIACKRGITVVNVTSHRMLMAYGFLAKIFAVFERHRTPIDMLATSEVSVSMTIDDTTRLEAITADLSELGEVAVDLNQAIVCVVGDRLRHTAGIAAQIFSALRQVNVSMVSHGASQINIGFVVAGDVVEEVVRTLHEAFFPREGQS